MEIIKIPVGSYQTNCYIVFDEDKNGVIIDPGFSGESLEKIINDNEVNVKAIILTHGHGDHVGGVEYLREKLDIPVIAHIEEKEILENPNLNLSAMMEVGPTKVIADKFVDESDIIEFGNLTFKVIHTPGHTKGGMCLYIDGHLFSGDTIFQYSIGRTDFSTGDYNELINSIKEKVIVLPDETKILSGHGDVSTILDEKLYNEFIK